MKELYVVLVEPSSAGGVTGFEAVGWVDNHLRKAEIEVIRDIEELAREEGNWMMPKVIVIDDMRSLRDDFEA